ncbi:MAG TPA: CHASE domain-containing protein [Bacillota bacterium]|nr:CHASE domain-containing protein [Bacillota bacterium]
MKLYVKTARLTVARIYHSLYFPPTVIFVAIMIVTIFGWHAARTSLAQNKSMAASSRVRAAEQSIRTNMSSYEEILQGGVGLLQGSDEVTKTDWANYLKAFGLNDHYRGVQSIGYIRLVTPDDAPGLSSYMATQGVDNFTISPVTAGDTVYAPITYAQPIASHLPPLYGFNMYSEPTRKAAMLRAQESGETTITGRLVPTTAAVVDTKVTGFNMYVPYYSVNMPLDTAASRQAAIRGYVFAGFRGSVLFADIAKSVDTSNAGFRIIVSSDPTATSLYQSDHFSSILKQPGHTLVSRKLTMYGQTWNTEYIFSARGLVSEVEIRRPSGVLFAGVFVAVLIAVIVLLLLRARAQELSAQKERAVELAKDELLSLASHQLRTPATGVKQYVGMILQGFAGDITDEQRTLLEKAFASNDRQLQTINEILHLAKIDAGRIVLAPTMTNLGELIQDIAAEQKPDVDAAHHHLKIDIPKKPIELSVDAHMLRMAIENVLSNAIKYTPTQGTISVSLFRRMGHIYIRITDTGVGIAQQDLEKMFKQFTRLPNEMSQQVGGTGIGLYLAKHLIELHGGTITVESQLGEGSTFTVILPHKM